MSTRSRLGTWWERIVVSPDPDPQHNHPAASTYPTRSSTSYPTRADVRDAIERVTTTAGIDSVHPAIKARIVDEVAALFEAPALDPTPSAWCAACADLATGDLAYGPTRPPVNPTPRPPR